MFGFIKKLFGVSPVAEAPAKVEAPAEVVVAVDPKVNPVVSTTSETVVIKETAKKPAGKKSAAKKPAAPKAAKPKKPKAPKAK